MKVYPGVLYQITGVNGSGKSLLLDVLAHRKKIAGGDILYNGKSMKKGEYSRRLLTGKISWLSQEKPFWPGKTVISYLQNALQGKNKSAAIAYQEAMTLLEKFDLKHLAKIKRRHLTRALYKKVELVKVLLQEKDILILDDPYSGMDEGFIKKCNTHIRNLVKNDKKTAIISHAGSLSRFRLIDVMLVLNEGHIVKVEKPQYQGSSAGRPRNRYPKRTQ